MATETKAKKPAAKKPVVEAKQAVPTASAAATVPADTRTAMEKRRVITGTVVSDKMQKTIVVKVDRRVRHELYKKYVMKSRRFKAHDEKNDAKIGDLVTLVESRPLSRDKRWALQSIVRRAAQALEANV
ncbi:MAG: 30S ribosomal protein S17 [Methylotenera sp.]|nr:30S ribosomal protein S17 [Oligoflexia bacterium]